MGYSIGQIAAKTGLSAHTLRYYEKEGLLPFVVKNKAGIRVFSDADLQWLAMIGCLKDTGMPLKDIKRYIDWFVAGDSTLPQRLDMFKRQRRNVRERMALLQHHLNVIDYKIRLYEKAVETGSFETAMDDAVLQKEAAALFK